MPSIFCFHESIWPVNTSFKLVQRINCLWKHTISCKFFWIGTGLSVLCHYLQHRSDWSFRLSGHADLCTVKILYFVGAQFSWISWNTSAMNSHPLRIILFWKEIWTTSYKDKTYSLVAKYKYLLVKPICVSMVFYKTNLHCLSQILLMIFDDKYLASPLIMIKDVEYFLPSSCDIYWSCINVL